MQTEPLLRLRGELCLQLDELGRIRVCRQFPVLLREVHHVPHAFAGTRAAG